MISMAMWILWVHILAAAVWLGGALTSLVAVLPVEGRAGLATLRRAHFLTSRGMEVVILTGLLNVLVKGAESQFALSVGFYAMLGIKMALLSIMAAIQIRIGLAWRQADGPGGALPGRVGLAILCGLGALAALLGLGLRVA